MKKILIIYVYFVEGYNIWGTWVRILVQVTIYIVGFWLVEMAISKR